MSDRIATTEVRQEGFYWVVLGQNPPEIAYCERGEWWLAGDPKPWHPEAVTVVSDRLVFRPRLAPWHELMARQVLNSVQREVLWTLTSGRRPRTLPADNLDDPAVHLLAIGLVEVVDGRLQATQAGYDLRKLIEREQR